MHKLRTAAVLVAALSTVGLLGAGTAQAHDGGDKGGEGKVSVLQSSNCRSHDFNLDILGQIGLGNGLGGNLFNGEGNPGAMNTHIGSTMGCNNTAFGK